MYLSLQREQFSKILLPIWLYQAPSDRQRVALVKTVKLDGTAWVSKYARGGSARTQSARRLYIAVDGLVSFITSCDLVASLHSCNLSSPSSFHP